MNLMTLSYFTKFNNILAHFDRLCSFGPTQVVGPKFRQYNIDKQQQIDRHTYFVSPDICWEIKLLKNTGRFYFQQERQIDGWFRFLEHIIKMDNACCIAAYLYLVPQLKRWFPHIPQHGQSITVPFGSTSVEILFPVSLVGFLTLLASYLGFSLPGILQMTEILNTFKQS